MDEKKYSEIKEYVQKNDFWREEFTGHPQFCFSFMHAYVDVKKIFGIGFDVCIIMLEGDYFYEVTPLKNKAPLRDLMFKKYVEVARKLGIESYRYEGLEQLKKIFT